MKKNVFIAMLIAGLFILLGSCSNSPELDDGSELFEEYVALEKQLDSIGRHPNTAYNESLNNFITKYDWEVNLPDIPDGVYEAYSVPDRYQYIHYVRLEVKDHKFVSAYYNEFLKLDIDNLKFSSGGEEGKRGDESYQVAAVISEAYPQMEKELLQTQNPMKVDGVTGASLAVNRFKIMVMKALYEYRNNVILNKTVHSLGDKFDYSIFN